MKLTITHEFEAGRFTCASERGKFCRYFHDSGVGYPTCFYFGPLRETINGWIKRHVECFRQSREVR